MSHALRRRFERHELLDTNDAVLTRTVTAAPGPDGALPVTDAMLRNWASGDLFGLTQNVGMGWSPATAAGDAFVMLSTQGGIRADDGTPWALGYHTGHWEVGLLMREAAKVIAAAGAVPFAAYCSDPCDGRTQGTTGMFDSLPYRNDAAIVLRRLIRSHPTRKGVLGVATCDKGLPAMMMALAGCGDLPCVLVPGGVTLPAEDGEDAGRVQTIGVRYAQGELTLDEAAELGCRACASPGGGCQFLGTAATSQVVAEALGLCLPHSALAPSGQPIWLDMAVRSARALLNLALENNALSHILTPDAVHNAMVVHAAFGGSTNLIMHLPAIAHAAKLRRPDVQDWTRVNRSVPRLVDALPNGPVGHTTVRVFLAGGVPEVMLHLRDLGLLKLDVMTVAGQTLGDNLAWWENSPRRGKLRALLKARDGVDPDAVIMSPPLAKKRGLTSTVCFPTGNLAPQGSVVKATAISDAVVDTDGVYRKTGPARMFFRERDAIAAIKQGDIQPGDVIVLAGRGPMGCGMEETSQITSALKYLSWSADVALITDARFSGFSAGPCIGHISPEALAGGPLGKLRDGDLVRIHIDRGRLVGTLDLVDEAGNPLDQMFDQREVHPQLRADANLPDDTRLWAALQDVAGGSWGGCVYDVDRIIATLDAGQKALAERSPTFPDHT